MNQHVVFAHRHVTSSPSSAQAHRENQRRNQDEPATNLDEPRLSQVQLRPGSSYKLDLNYIAIFLSVKTGGHKH